MHLLRAKRFSRCCNNWKFIFNWSPFANASPPIVTLSLFYIIFKKTWNHAVSKTHSTKILWKIIIFMLFDIIFKGVAPLIMSHFFRLRLLWFYFLLQLNLFIFNLINSRMFMKTWKFNTLDDNICSRLKYQSTTCTNNNNNIFRL